MALNSCIPHKEIQLKKTIDFGYYRTFHMMGGHGYDFQNDSIVVYKWSSDLFSFERQGKYTRKNDTIVIQFTPLMKLQSLGHGQKITELHIKNFKNQKLVGFPVDFFMGEKIKTVKSDSFGVINIENRIEEIDSIHFNWQFREYGIYPIDNKYEPKIDLVDHQLQVGYVKLEVKLVENLIGHPINRNTDKLLVIGNNKLFIGLDYDPDVIYLGGILEKEKSK